MSIAKKLSVLIWLSLGVTISNGQAIYQFKTGLAVPQCHRYGREALVTDPLAYMLYTDQFKKPVVGSKLFAEADTNSVWKNIEADSTGKFRGEALVNGYIYLSYQSQRAQDALLNVLGNSMVYFNGEPHGGDIYNDGWMNIPVKLKKGENELLIRCGGFARWQGISARLIFSGKLVSIDTNDATLPHIVVGKNNSEKNLLGAIVIINGSDKPLKKLILVSTIKGKIISTVVPAILSRSSRKIPFYFDPNGIDEKGDYSCALQLKQNGNVIDEKNITITAVNPDEHQSYTFISDIDGSVQYYGVAPQTGKLPSSKPALFLSVHGAGVQAIGQARAYQSKDWGVLVAPTNRRPRGFNWEDWGRMDALEVLNIATAQFNPDPQRIYLTGHSMGGHGTWYLGATYPEKWAAIAPCAGYPTLTGYGSADGKIPEQAQSGIEKTLLRASNASNVIGLAKNYNDLGIYIHHGDSDKVVSVNYARQMRKILGEFHSDYSYYEYPGGSHWFGNESVDWPPIFEYFRWHKIDHDSLADAISFVTANPAISSAYRWAAIIQQNHSLEFSKIQLARNRRAKTISGSTENVAMLKLELNAFDRGDTIRIALDDIANTYVVGDASEIYVSGYPHWKITSSPEAAHKNTVRSGAFKEAFNHRMVFVFGTRGNDTENQWAFNKARYDAEVWYYRGNGAVDIISDKDFSPEQYKDRSVILYGNSITNSAWSKLLKNCPINVTSDRIKFGDQHFTGKDLATYFTWPRNDSNVAMIAVVSGTGINGMRATDPNQYFAAGSGFPDYMIFTLDMLRNGSKAVKAAGFFNNQWKIDSTAADKPVETE
jgi:dienelactone hydrolase